MNPIHIIPISEERTVRSESCGRRKSTANPVLAFTLIELLVVISIIALLAGLVVSLAGYASKTNKRSRIRIELNQAITAIEAYKAHFGHYPPDNVLPSKIVNPVTNQLFYELTGVLVDEARGGSGEDKFHARDREQRIPSGAVMLFFHRDGFENAKTNPKELKSFLDLKPKQRRAITSQSPGPEIEVLAVSVDWPLNDARFPPPFSYSTDPKIRQVNPLRYVSTNPTNNPDGFDLWAEFVEGGKLKVICNWSTEILDK